MRQVESEMKVILAQSERQEIDNSTITMTPRTKKVHKLPRPWAKIRVETVPPVVELKGIEPRYV